MSANFCVGQRWVSESEPELGVGRISQVEFRNVHLQFGNEIRVYRKDSAPLKRFTLAVGDIARDYNDHEFVVLGQRLENNCIVYLIKGGELEESELSDQSTSSGGTPLERLFEGDVSEFESYELRLHARKLQSRIHASGVRGLVGPRVDPIPHQMRIAHSACVEPRIPRRLLSDEVGLGKTIEAGLIYNRLRATGQIQRTLIIVPQSLTHQWMVEMYRRFNTLFTLVEDEYCDSIEKIDPKANPFAEKQDYLVDMDFLFLDPQRQKQVLEMKWDLVIVDEAHRVDTGDAEDSFEYQFLEKLTRRTPGLLLLTATPIQLQLRAHYARLRLIDPARFPSFEQWKSEHDEYSQVADELGMVIDRLAEGPADWQQILSVLPPGGKVASLLAQREDLRALSPAAALRLLCDMIGTGRSVVRNTRHAIGGFPVRQLHSYALEADSDYRERAVDFLEEHEDDLEDTPKISFAMNTSLAFDKDFLVERDQRALLSLWLRDEKMQWLLDLLKNKLSGEKVLILCSAREVVVGIQDALERTLPIDVAVFFEDMPIVARDRAAAHFADPEGAQVLIASEIGSEGRNFQFAHHLVMFDLPLEPGLLEQRIGRLDRIGQRATIEIHVPYVQNSPQERLFEWYHVGLNAFLQPMLGVEVLFNRFEREIFSYVLQPMDHIEAFHGEFLPKVQDAVALLRTDIDEGRDKLMEFNSHDPEAAARVVEEVRDWDQDIDALSLVLEALEYLGVEVRKGPVSGSWIAKPSDHMKVTNIPYLPEDGLTLTGDRRIALDREDIHFLSIDHPLTMTILDLILGMDDGKNAFVLAHGMPKGVYFEFVYLWEGEADPKWNLQRLFASRALRVLVDKNGKDCTHLLEDLDEAEVLDNQPSLLPKMHAHLQASLPKLVQASEKAAAKEVQDLVDSVLEQARAALSPEINRMRFIEATDPKAANRRKQLEGFVPEIASFAQGLGLRLEAFRVVVAG